MSMLIILLASRPSIIYLCLFFPLILASPCTEHCHAHAVGIHNVSKISAEALKATTARMAKTFHWQACISLLPLSSNCGLRIGFLERSGFEQTLLLIPTNGTLWSFNTNRLCHLAATFSEPRHPPSHGLVRHQQLHLSRNHQ